MATASEQISILVRAEVGKAISNINKVNKQMGKTAKVQKNLTASTNTLSKAWKAIPIFMVIAAFKKLIDVTETQLKAEAQLEQVLKSTGGAAGITSTEVLNLASSLQKVTEFGDEATLQGQNLLLTFTNIGKDVFPAATETMLDMSVALKQDVKQSAIQLGKALNDPIQGVTALRRVGVQLSNEQQNQVKSFMAVNDVAGAQKVILDELNKEFGGSARAAAKAGMGLAQLGNQIGDLAEDFGKELMPGVKDLVGVLMDASTSGSNLNVVFKKIGQTISGLISGLAAFFSAVGMVGTAYERLLGDMSAEEFEKKIEEHFDRAAESAAKMTEAFSNALGTAPETEEYLQIGDKLIKIEDDVTQSVVKNVNTRQQASQKAIDASIKAQSEARSKFEEMRRSDFENRILKIQEEHAAIAEQKILNDEEMLELDRLTEEKKWMVRVDMAQKNMEKISQITNQFSSTLQKGFVLDQKLKEKHLDEEYNRRKSIIKSTVKDEDKQKEELAKLDAEFAKKRSKVKRDAAKKEKGIAIAMATINAAAGAVAQLSAGFPVGIIMFALALAMGLAQAAIVASTPIPAAFEGGVIPGTSEGTLIRAGEKLGTEAILPLENEQAMEKLEPVLGGGGTTIIINAENLYATEDLPETFALAIDQALLDLKQGGNSAFAESITEEQI